MEITKEGDGLLPSISLSLSCFSLCHAGTLMYTVFQSAEVVEYMNDMGYNVSGISSREFYDGV